MIDGSDSDAIRTNPSDELDLSNDEFLSLWYGARSVVNVAVGYRKYINKGLTLLGGFRTDFDYLKNVDFSGTSNEYNSYIKFNWDAYNFTGGARFNVSRHRFVVGAQYSLSREKNLDPLTDFDPTVTLANVPFPRAAQALPCRTHRR